MDIKYEDLEKELNNKNELKSVYLLYGNERYLIDSLIKKIKKQFGELVQGINYVIIDDNNVNDLIFNIETPAFGYDKKIIIAKNTGLFKKKRKISKEEEINSELEEFEEEQNSLNKEIGEYFKNNIEIINEMAVIIFVEEKVEKNVLYKAISENGVVCNIEELKPNQLITKLKNVCALYKVNVENSTLNYMIETCGTNLQYLMNEIRKLIEYAGENGTITVDAVEKLTIRQVESIIFELTDNLGNKNIGKAIEVLDNLIYQKEPVQKILIMLYNHFKKLYLCSIAMKLNKDIITALELKPNQTFLVSKYKKQVSYFKQDSLKRILEELIGIDYKSKVGLIDVEIALRSVLCNYCS